MKYKYVISREAARSLTKILKSDRKLYARILNVIESLSENPFRGKQLTLDFKGQYSLRVGVYRVIYEIVHNKLLVHVITVGHRKTVYKKK